jgi:hypothetical protein
MFSGGYFMLIDGRVTGSLSPNTVILGVEALLRQVVH